MSLPIRFLAEAKAEFDESADWYERQRPGLGSEFVAQIRTVLRRIAAMPKLHAIVYRDVRKAVVTRFPFVVLYREDGDELMIFHTTRGPAAWKGRV